MKKLVTLSFVLLAGIGVNAASITWAISGVTPASGESIPSDTYWTYCFLTSDSSGLNPTYVLSTLLDNIKNGTDIYDDPGVTWGKYVDAGGGFTYTQSVSLPGDVAADKSVTMHAYAIVIDASTPAEGSGYYRAIDCGDVTFVKDQILRATGDFVTNGSGNWPGMEPVPEPTSAALLLLGLCGMMLRRQRA